MEAHPEKVTLRIALIRLSISILMATICMAMAGCGEHAEPLDFDGPTSWVQPISNAR